MFFWKIKPKDWQVVSPLVMQSFSKFLEGCFKWLLQTPFWSVSIWSFGCTVSTLDAIVSSMSFSIFYTSGINLPLPQVHPGWAMKKHCCLWYIWDSTTQLYIEIIINPYKDPYWTTSTSMERLRRQAFSSPRALQLRNLWLRLNLPWRNPPWNYWMQFLLNVAIAGKFPICCPPVI